MSSEELQKRLPKEDIVVLERDDNKSSVILHLHGATILSWVCKNEEVLFLSKTAIFDNKKAIRGGIPLVFPCFGPWQHGPQHGFARIKRWKLESPPTKNAAGDVTCAVSLEDDEDTRKMWNVKFKLVYNIELCESRLVLGLTVNNTDSKVFDFTTLMHTYFRCSDISQVSVSGLKDLSYIDKVKEGQVFTEEREQVTVNENYDRVYQKCSPDVRIANVANGNHSVTINLGNFPDIVVWNPWQDKAKAMSDFDDEGYKEMLCVEAGFVSEPISVLAGEKQCFSQAIELKANL